MTEKPGLTYREAGVDIDAGNALVDRIRPAVRATMRPEVLTDLGGFGGLFALGDYRSPVLVSGTDGVGTKVLLAKAMGRHDTIGIDLVAMCVNDVIVQGAEPLFFLDYFATGKLDTEIAATVVEGIAKGCVQAGCALIGGETAEMPDVYGPGDYDLAGFNVGVVERDQLIDGSAIVAGDVVVGLASSGPHSNGFSLIRAIVERASEGLDTPVEGRPVGEWLLTPTTIYVAVCRALKQQAAVHGLAHITGGGLVENLLRVVPEGLGLDLDLASWRWPAPFHWLAREGNVARDEMMRTFNCGIGFCVVVAPGDVDAVVAAAAGEGIEALIIGRISSQSGHRLHNDVLHD